MESNKETLEEAIKREYERRKFNSDFPFDPQSFKLGAKWQAERMYSEEEVMDLFKKYQYDLSQWVLRMEDDIDGEPIPIEWFEKFKKY